MFEDKTIDFIWCYRVLRLIEPSHFVAYIKEFFRVLAPSGLIVFHQTAKPGGTIKGLVLRATPTPLLNLYHRKKYGFEVHRMKRERVEDLIHEAGGTVLQVKKEWRTPGRNWISFQHFAGSIQ